MKNMHKLGFAASIAVIAACVMPAAAFQEDGTVRIGMLESQTGPLAPYGLQGLWGSQIAIDEINAAGGVSIGGKQVRLEVVPAPNGEDAGSDPGQAIALLKKMVFDDQVVMVKGLSASSTGEAVFNYLNELDKQGAALIVHSSAIGAPGLGTISKWGFRNTFSENYVVDNVVKTLKDQGVKTAGFYILTDNVYFPSIADKSIIPAMQAHGIEVVARTEGVAKDTDLSRQVNELRQAAPDVVYVLAGTLPAINFMKEARRRNLAPKVFVGGISQLTPDTLKSGGAAVEGMVMAGSYDPASESIKAFATEFQKRHQQDISLFSVNGYEAMYLLKAGLEASGIANTRETLAEDRAKLRDAFEKASITSVTGETVAFNADHDTPKAGVLLTVKDGAFVRWNP